jgi:flavin reductase (DIM6/NTAB) family NADH-FMN oxidoreductase RutF
MSKIKIDSGAAFLYPMPMVLVGAVVEGRANFMAAAWVARVNYKPPLFLIALGPHHTNKGIEEHKAFSINIPDVSLIEKTDYCGLVSGGKTDKSVLFEVFYGNQCSADQGMPGLHVLLPLPGRQCPSMCFTLESGSVHEEKYDRESAGHKKLSPSR